jgi:hypothetical protein
MSAADVHERQFWGRYQAVYEKMLTHTSTDEAPWYVIPADHKWFTRAAVADVIVARLKALDLTYPTLSDERRTQLAGERAQLLDGRDTSAAELPALEQPAVAGA